MIWSELHGDMQSATEMSAPPRCGSNRLNGPKVRNREPTLSAMTGAASGYLLEHLENPVVLENTSDNPSGADNQQERLSPDWGRRVCRWRGLLLRRH